MMNQEPESVLSMVLFGLKCGRECGTHTGIRTLGRKCLVGDNLRLHYDTHGSVKRLDLVTDRRYRSLSERHHAHG